MKDGQLTASPGRWEGVGSHSVVTFCCAITGGIGLIVILGWILDIHYLRSLLPGYSEMKFNAAICLVALSAALLIDQFRVMLPWVVRVSRWLAMGVL